jgi:hypothetical protein
LGHWPFPNRTTSLNLIWKTWKFVVCQLWPTLPIYIDENSTTWEQNEVLFWMSWAQTWVHEEPLMYMLSNGNMIGKHWEQGKNMKICPLAKRESWTHHIYACWAFLLYHETLYFHNCSLPPTSHLCYPIITHIHNIKYKILVIA